MPHDQSNQDQDQLLLELHARLELLEAKNDELSELKLTLDLAGRVYGSICVGKQTYAHGNPDAAVEIAIKESVRVARRILAHAVAPPDASTAMVQQPQVVVVAPPPAGMQTAFPKPAIPPIHPQPRNNGTAHGVQGSTPLPTPIP